MDTFSEATEKFLKGADWLDDTDAPMVTALRLSALELDTNGVQAALLNTYGVTYRTLAKRKPATGIEDDDEAFLNSL